jgi:putative FmdB family regulatory protein
VAYRDGDIVEIAKIEEEMPIYEYECSNCKTRFEKMQSITAEPLTECVNCGGGPIRRVLHPVGVIFKGSGWYVNDSRKAAPSEGSSTSDTGTDSKPSESSSAKREEPAG